MNGGVVANRSEIDIQAPSGFHDRRDRRHFRPRRFAANVQPGNRICHFIPRLLGPGSNAVFTVVLPPDTLRWQAGFRVRAASLRELAAWNLKSKWIVAGVFRRIVAGTYPDAKNVLSFVGGHAAFTRIYWDGVAGSEPRNYEPPAGYDYNWDGE
jgi:hypothetical protein